ncbi:MAG: DUF4286 family protein [Bacteroidetes bacterium]|nr:DUF4286 family protein [Bacteroidota bacterium]MDA1121098.1 DUF4286 family protein [Bacteroidota bacterium]
MILYNLTVNVDLDIEVEWFDWIRESHIPRVMGTGQFVDFKIYRVLVDTENEGTTYALQFFAKSLVELNCYFELYAPKLTKMQLEKFKHKHVAFGSILESVI